MRISLSEIQKVSHTPGSVTEIGGYFEQDTPNGPIVFYKTVESSIAPGNTRPSLALPNGGLVWHAHPYHAGWWPSYEDLTRRLDNVHILFGFHGVWVYKMSRGNHTPLPKSDYLRFHKFLLALGESWDGNHVLETIQRFGSDFKTNYGLDISFIPYFVHGLLTDNRMFRSLV